MKKFCGFQSLSGRVALAKLLILAFTFVSFGQMSGQPPTGSNADAIKEFEVNGLKVIVKRRTNAPTVAAGLFIRGGVRNVTPETAGLEDMTLAVSVEASKKFPREALRGELTRMASSLGAGAGRDYSGISFISTRPNFDRTWDIFADTVMNPAFTPADFQLVKDRQLLGLKNVTASPDNALAVLEDQVIYAKHPYAIEPSGSVATVEKLTLANLKAHHKKIMQTSQLLLVVVGNVEPNEVQEKVAATIGKLPRGKYKEEALPELAFTAPSLDVVNRSVETNYVRGVFPAPSLNHPDYHAMRVAITMLQSRVVSEIRNKRQLSYAPNAEMGDNAANTANIYVTTDRLSEAIPLMLDIIKEMRKEEVAPENFYGMGGYFVTIHYLKLETNASQVADLARYELIGGGWRNSLKLVDGMLAVKPSDIRRVADKYMKNIRFVVIGKGDKLNRDDFLKQ